VTRWSPPLLRTLAAILMSTSWPAMT